MKTNLSSSAANYGLPRTISTGLKLKIIFGNTVAFIGIIFFVTGMIFPIIFGMYSDFSLLTNLDNEQQMQTAGVLSKTEATNSSENKKTIFKYDYVFVGLDGKEYTGISYSTGYIGLAVGDTVPVTYTINRPSSSNIEGMRAGLFPGWTILLTLIFPFVGLIMVVIMFRKGKKNLNLVQNGMLTKGKVTGREPTNVKINNRTVYKIFFEFKAGDGSLQKSVVRTHFPERVLDEAEERLVFDVNNPSQAILVDALPKSVKKFLENLETGI